MTRSCFFISSLFFSTKLLKCKIDFNLSVPDSLIWVGSRLRQIGTFRPSRKIAQDWDIEDGVKRPDVTFSIINWSLDICQITRRLTIQKIKSTNFIQFAITEYSQSLFKIFFSNKSKIGFALVRQKINEWDPQRVNLTLFVKKFRWAIKNSEFENLFPNWRPRSFMPPSRPRQRIGPKSARQESRRALRCAPIARGDFVWWGRNHLGARRDSRRNFGVKKWKLPTKWTPLSPRISRKMCPKPLV